MGRVLRKPSFWSSPFLPKDRSKEDLISLLTRASHCFRSFERSSFLHVTDTHVRCHSRLVNPVKIAVLPTYFVGSNDHISFSMRGELLTAVQTSRLLG